MSKLKEILIKVGNKYSAMPEVLGFPEDDPYVDEVEGDIKALMRETYNEALQLWIDHEGAADLDECFEMAVKAL